MHFYAVFSLLALPSLIAAQLSGTTGPLTSRASKSAIKTCNVLNYGAKADKSTDLGVPLASAFAACKSGGTIVIPSGDYAMSTQVELSGGSKFALQLDGIIYRTGSITGGNMIAITSGTDFELYSSTSKGAMQGYGYQFHQSNTYGPRLMRLTKMTSFSVHDIALVDSPAFHITLDTCTNGELYNMIIRGGNRGGLDGVDVWGTNVWVHDIEVTNKDECVTVKNPSNFILVENIYCNWSGGSAIGSLSTGTNIQNVMYRNIYTWQSNQMFMLKSNGGDGTVNGLTFQNFIGHSNAYSLDLNAYWSSMDPVAGNGILYENIKFDNWTGTASAGLTRGPINVVCPSGNPCHDISITNFKMWTDSGSAIKYICSNAYGTGGCLKSGSSYTAYTTTQTVSSAPSGYTAAKMGSDLGAGLGLSVSIAIPAIATSFFPGVKPATGLLNGSGGSAATPTTVQTSVKATARAPAGGSGGSGGAAQYAQCGGIGWTGATTCAGGFTCNASNEYYSQCL